MALAADVFVGRQTEVQQLERVLDRVTGGGFGLVLVTGEAGIGKSHLARELAASARASSVTTTIVPLTSDEQTPFGVWRSLLRTLGGAATIDSTLPTGEHRWEVLDATLGALDRASPLLLVVDDLQWADDGSLWVLERVAEQSPAGVLLVATVRTGETGSDRLAAVRRLSAVIDLPGLDEAELRSLLDLSGAPGVRGTADLLARTGGNPLFVRELLVVADRADSSVPDAIADVLRRSIDRAGSAVTRTLSALALDPNAPARVLALALDLDLATVLDHLEVARKLDLLATVDQGAPSFRHALLADAARATLAWRDRASIHTRLADGWSTVQGSTATAASMAHRLQAARGTGEIPVEDALDVLGGLLASGAHPEVISLARLLDDVLEQEGGHRGERARAIVALAEALEASGDDAALGAFDRACELADATVEPEVRGAAELGAAQRTNPFVPQVHGVARIEVALAALPADDSPLRADLLGRLSVLRCSIPGQLDQAHADADEAVAMARRLEQPELLVRALSARHFIPVGPAGLAARAAAAAEIVAVGDRLRRPAVALLGHEWTFAERLDTGDRNGADDALRRFEALAELMPSARWRYTGLVRRAVLHILDGDRTAAMATIAEAALAGADVVEPSERLGLQVGGLSTLAALWRGPDDIERAGALLEELESAQRGFSASLVEILFGWGSTVAGDHAQGRRALDRWVPQADQVERHLEGEVLLSALGELAARLGAREHAAVLRYRLAPYAERLGSGLATSAMLPVATTLGRLALLDGDIDAAVASHRSAVALVTAMPSPPLAAWAHHHLAEALAASGDHAGAAAARQQADNLARRCGLHLGESDQATEQPADTVGSRDGLLLRTSDGWSLESPYGRALVPDSLGLGHLAVLLAAPGQEVASTELAGMDASPVPVPRDLGPALDARAKREYRRRVGELQAAIDDAIADNDGERAALARIELEVLLDELRAAAGLGGRDRPNGSGAERARVNVTRNLKRAIAAVAEQAPDLGSHLDRSVQTGRWCAYQPDPAANLRWTIQR